VTAQQWLSVLESSYIVTLQDMDKITVEAH
jgi:hypothetical protein